eukprot:CAMPEP_0171974252 /NCGR_PEP_ID=MMETSP0993-20121228/231512_1 /TAXON_ID=483369 /ORGANISM="non described non described, Strain CCMP2098" /LENGTH=82 /DNA_ID=CAMNT_0012625213 /DNA_START=24 /DNA_END=269 /DNA_ORIENTATION=+
MTSKSSVACFQFKQPLMAWICGSTDVVIIFDSNPGLFIKSSSSCAFSGFPSFWYALMAVFKVAELGCISSSFIKLNSSSAFS